MYALQWPMLSYWEYTLKGERRFRQRLQSQVRITGTKYENTDLRYAHTLGHTRPTPDPSVAENAKRTLLLDQAILPIARRHSGTDLDPGLSP